jgi:ribosomal protein S18 acetylase RimI-like enzyme
MEPSASSFRTEKPRSDVRIVRLDHSERMHDVRALFLEYAASLSRDLCFQGFDAELSGLPGGYAPPSGCILLAEVDGALAGCIALRELGDRTCEMKRLYVRPEFRGRGVGIALVHELFRVARTMGYARMRLDTLPEMTQAIKLYRSLGFKPIPPYHSYPFDDLLFFEMMLSDG